jgi:regulator of replication initiation timing
LLIIGARMLKTLAAAVCCAAAIVGGDLLFRTSLLSQVRPIILTPASQAIVTPPVQVSWEGPEPMHVFLAIVGEAPRDLGVHESPFDIGVDQFPRDGGYQVTLEAQRFGGWIRAQRWFQLHAAPSSPPAPTPASRPVRRIDNKDLVRALEAARTARDRAHGRTKFLSEENSALRNESERLAAQIEALYKSQEDDAEHTAEIERRLAQLVEENRALGDENVALRLRLSSVIACTVWGYYSYLQPQTSPLPRRSLLVSDARGEIFRAQAGCENTRRADPNAASICFCIGNSWGG